MTMRRVLLFTAVLLGSLEANAGVFDSTWCDSTMQEISFDNDLTIEGSSYEIQLELKISWIEGYEGYYVFQTYDNVEELVITTKPYIIPMMSNECGVLPVISRNYFEQKTNKWETTYNSKLRDNTTYYIQLHAITPIPPKDYVWGVSLKHETEEIVTGIKELISTESDQLIQYYTLLGIPVVAPSNGIYIKVQGDIRTKVYIK